MLVYVALNSVPDYSAPAPSFKSVHRTLEGAIKALYPNHDYTFIKRRDTDIWEGPDGFGMVKAVELKD